MIQVFTIKLRNWIIPFKLVRLLVTHDSGKLTWVGKLSLAERLQGREGNPLARVTLATCLVNLSCEKRRNVRVFG